MHNSRGRARFGILVPFTNSNLEPDMALLRPEGVSMHFARMGGYDADEIPDEAQMQGLGAADLEEPLSLLSGVKPDVILYGCTSATLTHGPEFDRALTAKIKLDSGAQTVTAAGGLVQALQAIGAKTIGFASPYVPKINDMAIDFLKRSGIKTIARSEVQETLDNDGQGGLAPDRVYELGCGAEHQNADAIVLSCTDMRSVEVIDALEERLGKPVVTSNQAMLFTCLQKLQMNDVIDGYGSLLRRVHG